MTEHSISTQIQQARSLLRDGRIAEARRVARAAVLAAGGEARALQELGRLMTELQDFTAAEQAFSEAAAKAPDLPQLQIALGLMRKFLGRFDEAESSFSEALRQDPESATALVNLSQIRPVDLSDPVTERMERRLVSGTRLSLADELALRYALGRVYDEARLYREAFRQISHASRLKRASIVYPEADILGIFERVQQVFTAPFLKQLAAAGDSSHKPVFILGMPRSGTSLLEQILASHPQIAGIGEFDLLLPHLRSAGKGLPGQFPENVVAMDEPRIRILARHYLDGLTGLAPAARHVVSKTLSHVLMAGLLHGLFPQARFIHIRRGALDTCFSAYARSFEDGLLFSYDQQELGRYYLSYHRLMAHWQKVLPGALVHTVEYEDLVNGLEPVSRRLFAFLGVDWAPESLAFMRARRAVTTASAVQVRQPIYLSAVGRAEPYRAWLKPLIATLAEDPVIRRATV